MKKLVLIITLVLIGATSQNLLKAQVIDGLFAKKTTIDRKPAPLPVIRESDVIWSKTVWRIIDFREKANQHFYYPTRDIQGRNNLVNILLKGIEDKRITAFDATLSDNEFKEPINYNQVKQEFGDSVKHIKVTDLNTGNDRDSTVQSELPVRDVKQLEVKEVWYFDKQKSTAPLLQQAHPILLVISTPH